MEVKFIKLKSDATMFKYGTEYAAGADIFAHTDGKDIEILPGKSVMIHTGIALEIPKGYAGMIFARSGIASKRGLAPSNKVGVVDSDYRGEIMVSLFNHSESIQKISHGERIAQLVIMPYLNANFVEAQSLDETVRGADGFGSTGKFEKR